MRQWTAEDDATIIALCAAKATRLLGLPFSTIRNRKIKLSAKPDYVAEREAGYKYKHTYSYAAKIPCLKCRKEFASWDRRKNRICARCKTLCDF